jgi:hypothetical protein
MSERGIERSAGLPHGVKDGGHFARERGSRALETKVPLAREVLAARAARTKKNY